MVMNPETIQKLLQAGRIASQVKHEGAKRLAVPGSSILEILDYCEKRIKELRGNSPIRIERYRNTMRAKKETRLKEVFKKV